MVAISGYGYYYLKTLLEAFPHGTVELRAVVDPTPGKSDYFSEIQDRQIPIFTDLKDFYESEGSSDLVVISSPIHYHVPQSCEALINGSHVLCDKPLGATIQEVDHLIRTRDGSDRWVMVGYQWSYSQAIQSLKKDIQKGLFGKPVRLKTLCFWPRDEAYYARNDWAGRKKDLDGRWILDSPANNAMAHFLHNIFYVLGNQVDTSAAVAEVTAELYRANPIENYDTIACRAITTEGTECLFYASHAIPEDRGPMFSYEFEDATVTFGESVNDVIATTSSGSEKHYASPDGDHQFRKLFQAVDWVRRPMTILCGPEAARSQTLSVNGIQDSVSEIVAFPESMIHHDETIRLRWVEGLADIFYDCYQKSALPNEMNVSWARCGRRVDLSDYRFFPGGHP